MGIVNFSIESLVEDALEAHAASAADTAFLTSWAAGRTLPAKGADFGTLKGRNVIFIQMESMENWAIGYQINGQEVAPNLTALAGEGAYFSNYYSQDGEGNTADAEFSTQNSLYPLPDSVAFISHAQNQYAALPSLLDAHGYTTSVMHGDVCLVLESRQCSRRLGTKIFLAKPITLSRALSARRAGRRRLF